MSESRRRPAAPGALGLIASLALAAPLAGEEILTLPQAVQRALARAPGLASARAAAREGALAERLASDAFHPELLLTTTPGYSGGLPGGVAGRLPSLAGVELRETLYDPARRSLAFEARARSAAAAAALASARTDLARVVAELYLRCASGEALLSGAEGQREAYSRLAGRAEALHGEGRITDLALEQARLEEARARQAELDLESDRDLNELELARLTGWASGLPLPLEPSPAVSEGAVGDALARARSRDPELKALGFSIGAFEASVKVQRRRLAPVVEAAAQYSRLYKAPGYDDFYKAFKADDWSVGLFVALPLWSGGRASDAAARAEAGLERLESERRLRDQDLEVRLRRAEDALRRSAARASLERRAEGVSREALRLARALEGEGRAGDADDREIAALAASAQRVRAEEELLVARLRLLALVGDLPEALVPEGEPKALAE